MLYIRSVNPNVQNYDAALWLHHVAIMFFAVRTYRIGAATI